MGPNNEIYEVFRENIISFGLEDAARILGVDHSRLTHLLKYDSINYDNQRLRYTIKLQDYAKNNRRKTQVTMF